MNSVILTSEEMQRLDQADYILWAAYLKLRQCMNITTGITGVEKAISYPWLARQLSLPAGRGKVTQPVTKEQARYLVRKMEKLGLVIRSGQYAATRILLRHPLAATEKAHNSIPSCKQDRKISVSMPPLPARATPPHASTTKPEKAVDAAPDPVYQIFADWCRIHDHPNAVLTPPHYRRIANALAHGYSIHQCQQAISGCRLSDFHRGNNPQGIRYDSISLIFRDREHIERFIRLYQTAKNKRQRQPAGTTYSGLDGLAQAFEARYGQSIENNPLAFSP